MTDKPKMPEPMGHAWEGGRVLPAYTADQMEAYGDAIQEWAYGRGYDAGCRDTEIDND